MPYLDMDIRLDDLQGKEIAALLEEHHKEMVRHSPPESRHALDLESLRSSEITFWTAWFHEDLAGCGALRELGSTHGEIKSMRTSSKHLRKGVAARMLDHILEEAARRSYKQISLETGSGEPFAPARNLYESFGFDYCEPFAEYIPDTFSIFMTIKL